MSRTRWQLTDTHIGELATATVASCINSSRLFWSINVLAVWNDFSSFSLRNIRHAVVVATASRRMVGRLGRKHFLGSHNFADAVSQVFFCTVISELGLICKELPKPPDRGVECGVDLWLDLYAWLIGSFGEDDDDDNDDARGTEFIVQIESRLLPVAPVSFCHMCMYALRNGKPIRKNGMKGSYKQCSIM